jgi:hypothetical protein
MRFLVIARPLRNQAICSCGWHGKNRWFRGLAVSDAYLHGAESGHDPAGAAALDRQDHTVVLKTSGSTQQPFP